MNHQTAMWGLFRFVVLSSGIAMAGCVAEVQSDQPELPGGTALGSVDALSEELVTSECTVWGEETHGSRRIVVPLSSNGSAACWLARGSANDGVFALQAALKACWGQDIELDGEFGPETELALATVQDGLDVDVDGVYGPETRAAMGYLFMNSNRRECG